MELRIPIFDTHFQHSVSSCDRVPLLGEWLRDITLLTPNYPCVVVTDNLLFEVIGGQLLTSDIFGVTPAYGWLLESPEVTSFAYKCVSDPSGLPSVFTKFKKIFTFKKDLLELSDKFEFVPLGGCWIKDEDIRAHPKTKGVSIIASEKSSTYGQQLRHNVVNELGDGLSVYGRGYNPVEYKLEALKDYKYSIVIENCKEDYYFSEKLIDCIATGTIPIYWGCPSIGDFFNKDGILSFDTMDDLKEILMEIKEADSNIYKESVLENLEICKKYLIADDIIFKKLQEK